MEPKEMRKVRNLIVTAAKANGYEIEGNASEGNKFELTLGRKHVVDFLLKSNSSGYLQVQMIEERPDSKWAWGRAVYSIRSISEAFLFCNILTNSAIIAAKRPGDEK
jgi:hypothetical protein